MVEIIIVVGIIAIAFTAVAIKVYKTVTGKGGCACSSSSSSSCCSSSNKDNNHTCCGNHH